MESKKFEELHALLVSSDDNQLNRGYQILFESLRNKMIGHYIKKFKLNEESAQDLTHESLITIMEKAHTVKEPKAFVGWCWIVTDRKALDYLRKNKREKLEFNTDKFDNKIKQQTNINININNIEQRDCIRKGTEKFKKEYHNRYYALELYAQGYTHAEIAAHIDKTPGATKEFISQCRKIVDTFIGHCKEIK
jgi:RNA polymerase sigma factor (sigma-70 family)